ncbi:MAG TPA: biotin--[acetyl-CoA-carboxylase] ligase [Steroidobacteraceae bacterium]|nr:biotin--[acetyl-CoA-carboxylase] ligase [Steroidobacteraceae bacterium]
MSTSPRPLLQKVFQRLNDREFVSGETLAADLSVTRAAVWKAVEQLRELGVTLDASTHKGYRLSPGLSALREEAIEALLTADARAHVESLLVEWTLESTNTKLLDSLPPAAGCASVVLAEHQTGGRGRRGRSWVAPPGGAVCLSVAWQYAELPADLSALSLIVGLCAVNALHELGIEGVNLKWPNDLITRKGKLGGILIEMRVEAGGPVHLVVGIGLNVMLEAEARAAIKAAGNVADDIRAHRDPAPDRNAIVAGILRRLIPALRDFPRHGLKPHLSHWGACDALFDRQVDVENAGAITSGIARGIDTHGALLVETPGGVQRFISGEVSVRLGAEA